MSLYHHGNETYKVAVSEAAAKQRAKFEGWIEDGKKEAVNFFEHLHMNTPRDFIVSTDRLRFDLVDNRIKVMTADNEWFLHRNALNQMAARTGGLITQGMVNKWSEWSPDKDNEAGRNMLLHCLHEVFSKDESRHVLMRVVDTGENGGEVRGFLSDRYRRMNSGPLFESFVKEAQKVGAVPIKSSKKYNSIYGLDTRSGLSMFVPEVFEPVENEVMIVGLELHNSDFGVGALTLRMVAIRIWCTNMALRCDSLRKVHLGTRLDENLRFSEQTYQKDTETISSMLHDVTKELLSPSRINGEMEIIKQAAQEEVDPSDVFERMRKSGGFSKEEKEKIIGLYNTPDVELLPPGNNSWRVSNAISLFANKQEDDGNRERALELRQVAGSVLDRVNERHEIVVEA